MEFKGDYGFLSTFYPCSIVLDKETLLKYSDDKLHDYINTYLPNGFQLSCVEQGFQALKADKVEEFIDILNTKKGYEAKVRGKDIHNRKKWSVYRLDIMTMLNKEKFRQNLTLSRKLAEIDSTINNDISYKDYYWGRVTTDNFRGQNQLGAILNNERKAYRAEYGLEAPAKEKLFKGRVSKKTGYKDTVEQFVEGIKDDYFYVVDCETSGLDSTYWDVIELSAIKVNGNTFEIEDEFDIYVNPGYKLPPQIVKFNEENQTGICDEVLQSQGLKMKDALAAFKEFVGDNPYILGQNIGFDIKFIDKLYYKGNKEIFSYSNVCDTLKMAKEKIPGKHNLEVLYEMIPSTFNTPTLSFHKSIDDVKATLEVFKWLAQSEYHIPIMNKDLDIPTVDYNLD
jgi:DNA polymerase III epsilon subunit-like protein